MLFFLELFVMFQLRTVLEFVYLVCSIAHLLMFGVHLQMFVNIRLPVQGYPVSYLGLLGRLEIYSGYVDICRICNSVLGGAFSV